jgi:thiol-disulfide isomerase/thioredoxin
MSTRGVRIAVIALALGLGGAGAATVGVASAQQRPSGRPWLGVAMELQARAGGVLVKHVVRGSPAQLAGIHDGDRIASVDGHDVATSRDVTGLIAGHAVGDAVVVSVKRGDNKSDVRVSLAAFPRGDDMIRMDHVGTFAPTWRGVRQVSGNVPRGMSDLRGRVVLLDFWATWCAPCREMSPTLSALQAKYGAQGLSVIGISSEAEEDVSLFSQRMAMSYGVAIDANGDTTQAYTVSSLPTLFVIDKRGVVREIEVGYDPSRAAALENVVRSLLAEPAPTN